MKKILIFIIPLFIIGCSLQYEVLNEYDNFSKMNKTYETNNRVRGMTGSVYLILSMMSDDDGVTAYIRYDYRDADWIFLEQTDGIQLLLENGDVIKLSSHESPNREVLSGGSYVGISESGVIFIDRPTLNKILNSSIEKVRVYGKSSYKDYSIGVTQLHQRWVEFNSTHLSNF